METNGTQTQPTARCYQEFCCNVATIDVVVVDRSYNHSQPARPWGYCTQHAPNEAEIIARVTGSVASTYTVERRNQAGELEVLSRVEYRR